MPHVTVRAAPGNEIPLRSDTSGIVIHRNDTKVKCQQNLILGR